MKTKKISLVVLVVMIILLVSTTIISLTACSNDPNNNNDLNNKKQTTLDMSYMEGLTIDLSNVAGFSINASDSTSAIGCSSDDGNDEYARSYIYSSPTYTHGDVEYDKNSIKKVTFKKNTKKTEVITGPDGEIIDENTTITQDDIPALLNRMFVSDGFMFMQYILPYSKEMIEPLLSTDICGISVDKIVYNYNVDNSNPVLSARPNQMVYDEKGNSIFDMKTHEHFGNRIYYSSPISQSFVMDLSTGYIYKIEGMSISEICGNRIVKAEEDKNYFSEDLNYNVGKLNYYKLKINDKSELEFSRLVPNDNVEVREPIKDKYGYLIVPNSGIDEIDKINKIIYTTKYLYGDANGELCFSDVEYCGIPRYVYINGELKELSDNEMTVDARYSRYNEGFHDIYYKYYKGKEIYPTISVHNSFSNVGIINWDTLIYESSDGYMYYKKIDLDKCLQNNRTTLTEKDMTKIEEFKCKRYKVEGNKKPYLKKISNNQFKIVNDVYTTESINGTKYYTLEMENGIPVLKLIEDVTYQDNKFIFQPINK